MVKNALIYAQLFNKNDYTFFICQTVTGIRSTMTDEERVEVLGGGGGLGGLLPVDISVSVSLTNPGLSKPLIDGVESDPLRISDLVSPDESV